MADRTAADIFGRVFTALAKARDVKEAARSISRVMKNYDFDEEQMGSDARLAHRRLLKQDPKP